MTTHTETIILRYDPVLAKALRKLNAPSPGEAAVFLRQLEHWLNTNSGCFSHGGTKHWIYNGYKDWVQKQLTSLSESQFGRMVRWLLKTGMLEKTIFALIKHDLDEAPAVAWHESNTKTWITLCVDRIAELTGWRPQFPLRHNDHTQPLTTEDLEDAPVEEESTSVDTPAAQESLESLPDNVLHSKTSGFTDSHNGFCKIEARSIYKENQKKPKIKAAGDLEWNQEEEAAKRDDGSAPTTSRTPQVSVTSLDNSQDLAKTPDIQVKNNNSPRQVEVKPTSGWHCPDPKLRREFMRWLSETMPPIQSSAHAGNWCNKHPDDAELRWDDFMRFKNRKEVQQTGFASWNSGQHEMFIRQYRLALLHGGFLLGQFQEQNGAWLEWVRANHADWLSNS